MPSEVAKFSSVKNFTFDGELRIFLDCRISTKAIVLNCASLNISETSVMVFHVNSFNNVTYGDIRVLGLKYKKEEKMVVFELDEFLTAGKFYLLTLNYSGPISTSLAGYFRSSYEENNVTKWLSTTQFSPVDARKAFPSFDEPSFKAIFEIRMTHPVNYKAISNAQEMSREEIGDGWALTTFDKSPKMSTYIVGFTLCEFDYIESSTSNGVKFRVWARNSMLNQTAFAAEIGPKFLEFQESYFDVKFPLKKQDIIAIPDFEVAAMENWGMINFRESILLYDEKLKSLHGKRGTALTMAHELAHMWFGNLVTMEWFSDVWLKEGFASVMESITLDAIFNGSFSMKTNFGMKEIQNAMRTDQLATSHPLSVEIERAYEVYEIFDTITYTKSLAVINMVKEVIGEQNFKQGLKNYLTKYQYGNARYNNIWDSISEEVQSSGDISDWNKQPINISTFAAPWTLQMGFPVVSLQRDSENSLTVSQSQFRLDPDKKEKEKYQNPSFGYEWYVPLWIKTDRSKDNSDAITWMQPGKTTSIPIDSGAKWYIVDSGSRGYHRTNYDMDNWKKIQEQLIVDHNAISPQTRSQLIDDAFTFAQAGLMDYTVPLGLITYLSKEDNYVPFKTVLNQLKFIRNMFALSPAYGYFKEYMLNKLSPVYDAYGWLYKVPENDYLNENFNAAVIASACKYGHKRCLETAGEQFEQIRKSCSTEQLSSPCTKLQPQFRRLVYCNGVRQAGFEAWKFLWDKLEMEESASEVHNIFSGLVCSQEPWLINRLLTEAINGSVIRHQDLVSVFSSVSGQPLGMELLWSFFTRNWKMIFQKYGDSFFSIGNLITYATNSQNNEGQIQQLKTFLSANPETSKFSKFQSQLEKAEERAQWMKKHYSALSEWFRKSNLYASQ